jgi:hypothetical protein
MNLELLWNFWNFTSWTAEQTGAFWTSLGAMATVGTLWYAIRQGIKNSKKINDLAEISRQLSEQNKLLVEQHKTTTTHLKDAALPLIEFKSIEITGDIMQMKFINKVERRG